MSTVQWIREPDDPRLVPYRAIRERDLVGRLGSFVAEGELVVRALVRSPLHHVRSLLCLEARTERMADVIDRLPDRVAIYVVPRAVLDEVAGFPVHRGILAIGARGVDPGPERLLSSLPCPSVVLALIGMSNHDNVGALFRNAAAFGAAAVLLDDTCCDPLYRKAIRVSVGHVLAMPFARGGSGDEVLNTLVRHGFDPVALAPGSATALDTHAWQPRTALLLGPEGPGLPPVVIERSRKVGIPMAPGIDSLNVATAASIALHAARQALARRP